MNKKAGMLGVVFIIIVFLIMWFLFIGNFINVAVGVGTENGSISGLLAFFLENLNFFIFLFLIIFGVYYLR